MLPLAVLMAAVSCTTTAVGPARTPGPSHTRATRVGLAYFLPSYIPKGMRVLNADILRDQSDPASFAAVMGRRSGSKGFAGLISVSIHEASRDREVAPEERRQLRLVRIRGGVMARIGTSPLGVELDWFQNDLAIAVAGPPGSKDLLLVVARGLRVPSSKGVDRIAVSAIPRGYEMIAKRAVPGFHAEGYVLNFTGDAGKSLVINVTIVPVHTFVPSLLVAGGSRMLLRTIRGSDAAVGINRSELSLSGGRHVSVTSSSLAWLEHPDLLIFIFGAGLTQGEVVRVAEGLQETTEKRWRAQMHPPAG